MLFFEEIRRFVFLATADFAQDQDRLRLRIFLKKSQKINKARAIDGIAADADHRRLADPASESTAKRLHK